MPLSRGISHRSSLKLGASGRVNDVPLTLKGYVRCTASDDEDTWYWEEWYGGTVNGQELWIEYDEESQTYTLFKKLPTASIVTPAPWRAGKTIEINTKESFRIAEVAHSSIIEVEGELPEGHTVGSTFVYHESTVPGKTAYTIETSDEIEIFKGEVLQPQELFKNFNLTGALAKWEWLQQQKKLWNFGRLVSLTVAGISILGVMFTLASGNKVFDQTFQTCSSQTTILCTGDEVLLGPVTLDQVNRAHKITIKASRGISQSNWQAVTVTLLDNAQQPLSAVEGDFWEEAWREGGESGVESNTSSSKHFRLTKAGEYYLKVNTEAVPSSGTTASSLPVTLSIQVFENVWYWPYFVTLLTGSVSLVGIKDKWYQYLGD